MAKIQKEVGMVMAEKLKTLKDIEEEWRNRFEEYGPHQPGEG